MRARWVKGPTSSRVVLAIVLALLAAACSPTGGTSSGDRLTVVVGFYPLAEAAQRIGGDSVSVVNLTPPGVEPHDLELSPDDVEAIVTADVVLFVGGGFQPALEDAVGDASGIVVDVLDAVSTLPPPDDAEGVTADPHAWLDPERYAQIVSAVADALGQASPQHAAAFAQRADRFAAELSDLDQAFAEGLASCASRTIVVNHAAFAYLADAYDLKQLAISGISPEAEPDPERLAQLRDLVQAEGITTVFTEALTSPDVAETLAREAGVTTALLNPLEGLTAEQQASGQDYGSIMRQNLQTLRGALGCS